MRFSALITTVTHASLCFAFPPSYFERRTTLGTFSIDQLIDVNGTHAFQPPQSGDLRGPCPGLNAMSNHGYIPRNGIVLLADAITQSNKVFGLAIDTSIVAGSLAVFGADLLSPGIPFSIGGPPPYNPLLGVLSGRPTGLSGTHNQFESDTSVTRGDFYQFNGNNYDVQVRYFKELYDLQPQDPSANYNQAVLARHIKTRFQQSIAENPRFFHGPVQMAVSALTHLLVFGLMANHSAAQPDGFLQGDVLKSFYGIATASDGTLSYTHGHERIPDNWYRRPVSNEYSSAGVVPDFAALLLVAPEILAMGGNTNGTNTYAPLNVSSLTGGVYSAESLLVGNNAACFLFQALTILFPDVLNGVLGVVQGVVQGVVASLSSATASMLAGLTCPQLTSIDKSVLEQYPGYK